MPTYEYRCNACKREFEYQQRMADDDLVKCEVCGEDKLEKLISWSAFQLKGSGWYKDLYSSNPADKIAALADRGVPPKQDKDKDGGKDGGKESSGETAKASGDGAAASAPAAPSTPAPAASTGSSSGGATSGSSGSGSSGSGSASKD